MTTKYSEEFKADNPTLPQLRKVIEDSIKGSDLSQEQIDTVCNNVGSLILETVPELIFINASDSFLFESGFEECTKQSLLNLKKIGIEKK
mgnify:CR=1 FL=1